MGTLDNTIIILSIAVIPFLAGYRYHKWITRPRVSRPKLRTKLNIKHDTKTSTIIISPSKLNDRRNIEKNLTD